MPAPCPICQPIICDAPEDTTLYSLQRDIFPFVLFCPPGFNCGLADGFKMVCCGQLISVSFPPGATADEKTALIQSVVNQCAAILPLCGQGRPACSTPPCDTTKLFYNRDATCSIPCPDGTVFFYTVAAGTFAALTQAIADQEALDYACQQVALRQVCIGNFSTCACVGSSFLARVPITGGIPPITFSVFSGFLPGGLSLSSTGTISGTPTTAGVFDFQIRARSIDGGFVIKPFQISVIEITSTSLPAFTIGVPYSYQLTAAGGSGNYKWKIVSGTLPPGLVMDNNGLISGTPV